MARTMIVGMSQALERLGMTCECRVATFLGVSWPSMALSCVVKIGVEERMERTSDALLAINVCTS